ncbi:hypothetical protein GUJ93_ZPchr0002g24240 [Zizania palustris]|uniref:Uncharacterized protein n=1 Tax=Zizania palustris TaxID=103762 RepID=A0A8J5S8U5_ZIZPA|nr:hypothetical protein GUJ93_ZPchr0002g24240 [Zizania palustris]
MIEAHVWDNQILAARCHTNLPQFHRCLLPPGLCPSQSSPALRRPNDSATAADGAGDLRGEVEPGEIRPVSGLFCSLAVVQGVSSAAFVAKKKEVKN